MFENLQEKLQRAFKNLRGQGTLTEENIQEALKEIRMACWKPTSTSRWSRNLLTASRQKPSARK